jgi:hypothetical protein
MTRKLGVLGALLLAMALSMGAQTVSPSPITVYCVLTATGYCPNTTGAVAIKQGIDTHNVYIVPEGTPGTITVLIQGSVIGDFTDAATCGTSTTTTANLLSCSGIYAAIRVRVSVMTVFTSVKLFYVGTSTVAKTGGGAVASVTGAGTVSCSPTTGAVVCTGSGASPAGSSGDLQDNNGSGGLGAAALNDNGTTITLTETLTPKVAAAKNLGTAPLPFGDGYFGGAANHSFHFDTSSVASNVAVAIPNHASNTVQGIANPSDSEAVNYIDTSGVQQRIAIPGTISGLTTGFFPKATSATAIGNSLCDEGITTANTVTCTDTAGLNAVKFISAGDGTHAGIWTPVAGTAPSLTANTANLIGPASAPSTAFAFAMPIAIFTTGHLIDQTVAGAVMTLHDSGIATANVLASAQYKTGSCQTGLGDGVNAIPNATYLQSFCYNDSGVTRTITAVKCDVDSATGTPTLAAAGATLGSITAAFNCSTSFAAASTLVGTALTSGDWINFTFVSGGTAKQSTWVVSYTQ